MSSFLLLLLLLLMLLLIRLLSWLGPSLRQSIVCIRIQLISIPTEKQEAELRKPTTINAVHRHSNTQYDEENTKNPSKSKSNGNNILMDFNDFPSDAPYIFHCAAHFLYSHRHEHGHMSATTVSHDTTFAAAHIKWRVANCRCWTLIKLICCSSSLLIGAH